MKIVKLLQNIDILKISGDSGAEVKSICFDSRKAIKGSLFVAVGGNATDGHQYIAKAAESGASVIVYQDGEYDISGVTMVKVADSRKALAQIADNFYDHPSSKLNLVGITGTNGKTTTVTLLYRLFSSLGYACGLLSTIANYIDGKKLEADHTTPDPVEINALLAEMVEKGCEYCFMEVSSHSLSQDRVFGLKYKVAIFSNLTHDHLDYHRTFAEYLRCKKIFFDNLDKDAFALTNADDRNGEIMLQNTKASQYRYSCRTSADFHCRIIEQSLDGMLLEIDGVQFWSKFIGAHNAYNLLAVYGTAMLLGADKEDVIVKMSALDSVSGRLEYIKGGKDITAVVDYAHTPDALQNVLKTLKEAGCDRQLICVFGCGGDRDKTKRPEMGVIAAQMSSRVIVTSDNPRTENPESIINDIKAGLDTTARAKCLFITDRKEAIRTAIALANEGAIILVAGKGHEDYQIIGTVKHHFDDKEVIRETFNEM